MSEILLLLTAVFAVSSVLILVLEEFSHPYLPAYIAAGLMIGHFVNPSSFYLIAEIGIAFLVFIFGLKLEPERLRSVAKDSQAMTTVQVTFVGLFTYISGLLIGLNPLNSLYLSMTAALSSSLIGMQLIHKEIEIDLLHGKLAESTQLVQDIIAIVVVITLNSIYSNSNTIFMHALMGLGLLGTAGFIRKFIFADIAESIDEDRELMVMTSLGFLTGYIAIAQVIGLSTVVGAFAAGIAISKFPYNIEVVDTIEPLKDFFSLLFFVSLGALIVYPSLEAVLIAAVLLFFSQLVKPVMAITLLIRQGYDKRTAHLAGFNIDQISEFALIIAIQAYIGGLLNPEVFQGIILAASASFLISSYTSRHGEQIHKNLKWFEPFKPSNRKIKKKSQVGGLEDHVILVGYDTQAKIIAEALKEEDADFVVIENNPDRINEAMENENNYIFGDAMDESTWEKANLDKASVVISTVPVNKVSRKILGEASDTDVSVRVSRMRDAKKFVDDSVYVEVPDLLASERLADHIRGVLDDPNYREELRRRNLLEIRRLLNEQEE
ncbi:MAG: cation:proton antiporter [Candidatus Nanohalobium sp.]